MNKEYWFFRLKDDFFFKDKNIRKMKRMPNSVGCEYIVILLELYCLSLENGGVYEADHNVYGEVDSPPLPPISNIKISRLCAWPLNISLLSA